VVNLAEYSSTDRVAFLVELIPSFESNPVVELNPDFAEFVLVFFVGH